MYKYLPTYVYLSIYDINFTKLYANGIRNIITDLDNTLLSYHEFKPTAKLVDWINDLKSAGFKIFIISNNNEKRLKEISTLLGVSGFLAKANKPNPQKTLAYLTKMGLKREETLFLGDQLVTDIACANKLKVQSILVKTIDLKNQKWYTKINRLREKSIIKKIQKINPTIAEQIKGLYGGKK